VGSAKTYCLRGEQVVAINVPHGVISPVPKIQCLFRTNFRIGMFVSTVFIGLELPPGGLFFETMSFGFEEKCSIEDEQWRWATYKEAKHGHIIMVRDLNIKLKGDPNWMFPIDDSRFTSTELEGRLLNLS
jgi:hypothetical protein